LCRSIAGRQHSFGQRRRQVRRHRQDRISQVRASDVVGRLGGDEFAVLLWNLSETDARAKAASLEEAIDRLTFVFRGNNVSAGASAGVAILGLHAEAGRALEEADSAMYVRKAQRRHESES
jgi:diguanylate cyclase (GGDEF)-like protein